MKISEMSVKDRFDDIIDLVVAMRQSLEDEGDMDLDEYSEDCDIIIKRIAKLRDDVEKKE